MAQEELARRLDEIGRKLALLQRTEAEHGFGVTIEPGEPLAHFDGPPTGTLEVFSLIERLEGSYFRFVRPVDLTGPDAWAARRNDPYCPMGNPLEIGYEIRGVPDFVERGGAPIRHDIEDGGVYYLDPDEYVWLYKNPDADVQIDDFAPDLATFFDEFVLGPKYPELTEVVLGLAARDHEIRKGRHKGQYTDSWRRLLIAAGLSS